MPRASSGVYTLPAGNPVVTGTTIQSTWANTTMSDVGNELTNSLDRGGRGGMTAALKAINGSVATPGYVFTDETTSGFSRPSAGQVSGSILGAEVFRMLAGQFAVPLGSAGTPSLSFFGDANTGMWSPSADTIAWGTGGVERFRTASAVALTAYGVSGNPVAVFVGPTGGGGVIQVVDGQAGSRAWGLEVGRVAIGTFGIYDNNAGFTRFSINSTGNVSIPSPDTAATLGLRGAAGTFGIQTIDTPAATASGGLEFYRNGTLDAYLGIIGAANELIVGSAQRDFILRTVAGKVLLSADNGATAGLALTTDHRLYGSALHNNAGSVTGTTNQYIASGTYTPTLTNVANAGGGLTANASQWTRVGNVVTVSGSLQVTLTVGTANTSTSVGITLPIASNLTNATQCAGTGISGGGGASGIETNGQISGDVTNDRATLRFNASGSASIRDVYYTFTYVIL
jgi:hypothetical protein